MATEQFKAAANPEPTLDQSGVALVEVMIGFTLGAIIMVGMAGFFNTQNQSIQGLKAAQVRDNIATFVARYAGDSTVLTASANWTPGSLDWPANDAAGGFKDCWLGVAGHTCADGAEVPFTLVDSFGAKISGPGQTGVTPWDGTTAVYSNEGVLCGSSHTVNPDSNKCPMVVYTTFTAKCGGGACAAGVPAQSVKITYSIRQGNTAHPVLLKAGRLKPFQGSINVMVPTSSGFPLTSCPGSMSPVGAGRGFFCIHTAAQAALDWATAASGCLTGGYSLCTYRQYSQACGAGLGINLNVTNWTTGTPATGTDRAVTIGGAADCTSTGTDLVTNTNVYRCCTQ